jgi:flagellar motor switch/type III secretory pathway protein FliN
VNLALEVIDARRLELGLPDEPGQTAPATLGLPRSKERWNAYADVPARLSVQIPMPRISLHELLALKPGAMLVSNWLLGADVPLLVGDVFLANVSCEPAGERLGVRINGFDQPTHGM